MKKIYKTQAKQVSDLGQLYLLTHYTLVIVTELCPHQYKHRTGCISTASKILKKDKKKR